MKSITIYLYTSGRKNSKCIHKTFNSYDIPYRKDHIMDGIDFIVRHKETHKYIGFVAYDDKYCIRQERIKIYSIEQHINNLYQLMRYMNLCEFEFTQEELHRDTNTRYHINKYYHS